MTDGHTQREFISIPYLTDTLRHGDPEDLAHTGRTVIRPPPSKDLIDDRFWDLEIIMTFVTLPLFPLGSCDIEHWYGGLG